MGIFHKGITKTESMKLDPDKSSQVHCAFNEMQQVESLVPHPRNPNQHSPRQVILLAKIIEAQGWRSPIVVSERSGFIVAGHARHAAARKLGLDLVPVNVQPFENEAAEWAHLLADNRIAELADIDRDGLAELIKEMEGKIDMELTGFDETAVSEILEQMGDGDFEPTDDDQNRLDEVLPLTCPYCEKEFRPPRRGGGWGSPIEEKENPGGKDE